MSCNLTAVRSVPGRAFSTTLCRQPGYNETETLGHVLGFCRKGKLLRNKKHHKVRGSYRLSSSERGWKVHEEVHCISEDDSHRRTDIIAVNRQQQKAIIIDSTIRMERDLNQAHQVDHEKRAIYEPCIPYLSAKYNIPLFNCCPFSSCSIFLSIVYSSANNAISSPNLMDFILPPTLPLPCSENSSSPNSPGWREVIELIAMLSSYAKGHDVLSLCTDRKSVVWILHMSLITENSLIFYVRTERLDTAICTHTLLSTNVHIRTDHVRYTLCYLHCFSVVSYPHPSDSALNERIPNLTGEQSYGITVFRIPPMTSLMLHRCRTGAIKLAEVVAVSISRHQ
ncbi:hypothetical protein ANN_11123 [Periplaneta americana]|uniref:Uncharacterized protein n=1 Tax=Periplaneta americana TaxID=6978 RepID=A0ABQ8T450_PERAM|nr:hypothetical protein ANN_11123 [Periplaneta americana]